MSDEHDVTLQKKPWGPFTEEFLDRFYAVKARLGLATWQIAEMAQWSASYLGNCTRRNAETGEGIGNNVNPAFAVRLRAVIERLEAAPVDADLATLFPGPKTAPPTTTAASVPSAADDLVRAVTILRQLGISGIRLFPS
jgi:hypothetical protein